MNKNIINLCMSVFISTNLINPVFASNIDIPSVNQSITINETQLLNKIHDEINNINIDLESINIQIIALESQEKQLWGLTASGKDVTWYPALGFILPGLTQILNLPDDSSPPWLRIISGLQLISLGLLGTGYIQASEINSRVESGQNINQNDVNLATGLFLSGAILYTSLGIIPSSIVAGRDNGVKTEIPIKLKKLNSDFQRLTLLKQKLLIGSKILNNVVNHEYKLALDRVELEDLSELNSIGIRQELLSSWKNLYIQKLINTFETQQNSLSLHEQNKYLKDLLRDKYLKQFPEIFNQVSLEQIKVEKAVVQNNYKNEWDTILQFASQEKYETSLVLIKSISRDSPFYLIAQEKKLVWEKAAFEKKQNDLWKNIYSKAVNGNFREAYLEAEKIPNYSPVYQIAQKKSIEWKTIAAKQEFKDYVRRGFLSKDDLEFISTRYFNRILLPTYLPGLWIDWKITSFTFTTNLSEGFVVDYRNNNKRIQVHANASANGSDNLCPKNQHLTNLLRKQFEYVGVCKNVAVFHRPSGNTVVSDVFRGPNYIDSDMFIVSEFEFSDRFVLHEVTYNVVFQNVSQTDANKVIASLKRVYN